MVHVSPPTAEFVHIELYLPVERQYSHEQRLYRRAEEAPHAVRAGPQPVLSKEELVALVKDAVKHSPSSFNSQSSRALVLFGAESVKLWDLAIEAVRKRRSRPKASDKTEAKLKSCRRRPAPSCSSKTRTWSAACKKFALYADNFPVWSEQAGGMAQLVWAALANAGVGASLQHYNPLVDADVARAGEHSRQLELRARRCRSARTKPASAKRPSWTTPSASARGRLSKRGHAPRWRAKPAPVSTKTARVLFWARFLALRAARRVSSRKAGAFRTTGWRDRPARTPAGPVPARSSASARRRPAGRMPVPATKGRHSALATVAASAASQVSGQEHAAALGQHPDRDGHAGRADQAGHDGEEAGRGGFLFGKHRAAQVDARAPASASGAASTMSPAASAKPSTSTSERTGPIWRGGNSPRPSRAGLAVLPACSAR